MWHLAIENDPTIWERSLITTVLPTKFVLYHHVTLVKARILYALCICGETDPSQTNRNLEDFGFFQNNIR